MSQRDDQRVIDALRAYTGGLTVTDQDIFNAESRLRERLAPPSPRRRMALLAAVAAVVLVVGFFAFQTIRGDDDSTRPVHTPSPADTLKAALQADAYNLSSEDFTAGAQPTAADLAGFWMLRQPYGAPMFVESDGDWHLGFPSDLSSGWYGPSTLDGDTWTRQFDDSSDCTAHSWHAALAQDGSLRLDLTAGRNVCTPAETREVWDRVGPGSPVGDYLVATAQRAHWQPAPLTFRWQGLYVAPASGHVLEVGGDGTYRYYDTLTEATLTPADQGDSASIGACSGDSFSAGIDVAVLPAVTAYVGSYDAVRVTPAADACASGVSGGDVWVKLFDE